MDRSWIKTSLKDRGYTQKDVARLWGVAEPTVSKFLQGTESADPYLSRAVALAQMLGISTDELAKGIGLRGPLTIPAGQQVAPSQPPLGTISMQPQEGRMRIVLHIDVPVAVAAQIVSLLGDEKAGPKLS